jgi:hypothetical protein
MLRGRVAVMKYKGGSRNIVELTQQEYLAYSAIAAEGVASVAGGICKMHGYDPSYGVLSALAECLSTQSSRSGWEPWPVSLDSGFLSEKRLAQLLGELQCSHAGLATFQDADGIAVAKYRFGAETHYAGAEIMALRNLSRKNFSKAVDALEDPAHELAASMNEITTCSISAKFPYIDQSITAGDGSRDPARAEYEHGAGHAILPTAALQELFSCVVEAKVEYHRLGRAQHFAQGTMLYCHEQQKNVLQSCASPCDSMIEIQIQS